MFKKFSIVCGNFETPQEPPKKEAARLPPGSLLLSGEYLNGQLSLDDNPSGYLGFVVEKYCVVNSRSQGVHVKMLCPFF